MPNMTRQRFADAALLASRWNPEALRIRRHHRGLRVGRALRNPAVWHRLRPIDGIGERAASAHRRTFEMRIDILPNNLAGGCDLEKPSIHPFVNERVAVRKP